MKSGILFSGACKNNTIYNNTIKGNIQNGIFLYNGANNCRVNNNKLSGTTTNGVYIYGSQNAETINNILLFPLFISSIWSLRHQHLLMKTHS